MQPGSHHPVAVLYRLDWHPMRGRLHEPVVSPQSRVKSYRRSISNTIIFIANRGREPEVCPRNQTFWWWGPMLEYALTSVIPLAGIGDEARQEEP